MYKDQHRWTRLALIAWDCVISVISFLIAGYMRFGSFRIFFGQTDNKELFVSTFMIGLVAFLFAGVYNQFIKRGYIRELGRVIRFNAGLLIGFAVYIFGTKNQMELSRLTLLYFIPVNILLMYLSHCLIKWLVRTYASGKHGWKTLIVTDADNVERTCRNVQDSNTWVNLPIGVLMLDGAAVEASQLQGIPLIGAGAGCVDYVIKHPVDEVLIAVRQDKHDAKTISDLTEALAQTGAVISIQIDLMKVSTSGVHRVKPLGDSYVASFADREYDFPKLCTKRAIDIIGGLVGTLLTLVISLFLAPAILLDSPGPLLFKQKRVGRNGRVFTIYKFRSMYVDAEARKAELTARNKMNGLMFKMDDDPRITRIGSFIRKTSLDELPQFFNILIGDMSLVGTRPPTLDEYSNYTNYYKKRLSFRPGLTGMWQTSGRSDVTDFEDVMRLDLKYISDWSLALDFKLLIKTVQVVLMGRGAK